MARLYDLARMTTATTGTGTITLGSAVSSYLTFAQAGVQNGDTVTYAIEDGANREIGRGVYTSSGTTLTRAQILRSTNSNAAIVLSGQAQVFIAAAAEDMAPQTAAEQSTVRTTLYAAPYDVMALLSFITNGSQEVSQQFAGNTYVSGTGDNGNNVYITDQWGFFKSLSGTWNAKQSTDAPTGFSKSLEINAAGTQSLAAGDYSLICQFIEGTQVAALGFGTASAPKITLGFLVKAARTGTMTVGFGNASPVLGGGSSSTYRADVTINAANTWEFKTVTLDADTANSWTTGNLTGLVVWFGLGAGSNNQSATLGSWDTTQPLRPCSTAQTHFLSATNDYLRVTGVFLVPTADTIVSSRAVLFRRNLADETDACLRYYETSYNTDVAVGTVTTTGALDFGLAFTVGTVAASPVQVPVRFRKTKRGAVTIAHYSPATGTVAKGRDVVAGVDVNTGALQIGFNGYVANFTPNAAATTLRLSWHYAASARL